MQVHFSLPFGKYWALEFTAVFPSIWQFYEWWGISASRTQMEGGVRPNGQTGGQ